MSKQTALATFAGGCFWCMVKPFDQFEGIHQVVSGYMGGHVADPTYEQVKTGETGHFEVVQISYDPSVFSYQQLLDIYWPQVDPTDDGGQFHDRGSQYRAAIFYHDEEQKQLAEQSKQSIIDSGRFQQPIVTEILPASTFYRAETHHQDFYKKNKKYYQEDRAKSGRDEFIENHWS
ncbi:peptide-methionine (S)-S-oxide reductase MsrA [Sediminibacillus halophilus]|uniref:Peptide methionine sulfoxide reductase MsrA n=1 Tax=Sediminibacillus halophilus TaxID=482461 RepID=A0A1G9M732_9BACI|nr:peptide-methionine (S)-S-oxide reductase MsrA [Sediminibacillus halophilus]SDL69934.1 peptide-methionine (S)-S-oxide reductase [Sediminibacillus halophilus]